jgi:hypothetical protein
MTTHTTLSAVTQAGRKDRPPITGVLRAPTPPQSAAFLIANLELELIASNRKTSPLEIPNRKKTRVLGAPQRIPISLTPQWHRHSCLPRGTKNLCAVAWFGIPSTEAVTSLPSPCSRNRFRNHLLHQPSAPPPLKTSPPPAAFHKSRVTNYESRNSNRDTAIKISRKHNKIKPTPNF